MTYHRPNDRSSKTSKPVLIFVPGSFHTSNVFDRITTRLEDLGYTCIGYEIRGIMLRPAVQNLQPDFDALHELVDNELGKGQDVVVVAHSFGGMIATGALDGLAKRDRQGGETGCGVVKLAYITALMAVEGVSILDGYGGKYPDWLDVDVSLFCLASK
jgi:pimeloyl-ACP methyl ester carboxylesterase